MHCGGYIKHLVGVVCAAAQGKVLVNTILIYWLVQYGNVYVIAAYQLSATSYRSDFMLGSNHLHH